MFVEELEPVIIKRIGRIEKMKYGIGIDVSKGKSTVSILSIEEKK